MLFAQACLSEYSGKKKKKIQVKEKKMQKNVFQTPAIVFA